MDYNELINDIVDFTIKNYIAIICIFIFIVVVIIGYFADRRKNKKQKEEKIVSNNLPAVQEISVPALEPAIDIIPEPDLNYETSYNDFQSLETPYTFEKQNEDKVDINTMSGKPADISPEIDKIFQDFNFGEEEVEKEVIDKPEIEEEKPIKIDEVLEKVEEKAEDIIDNDMDYEDIKPDKSILDEIKPYSNDQDNINNLF